MLAARSSWGKRHRFAFSNRQGIVGIQREIGKGEPLILAGRVSPTRARGQGGPAGGEKGVFGGGSASFRLCDLPRSPTVGNARPLLYRSRRSTYRKGGAKRTSLRRYGRGDSVSVRSDGD